MSDLFPPCHGMAHSARAWEGCDALLIPRDDPLVEICAQALCERLNKPSIVRRQDSHVVARLVLGVGPRDVELEVPAGAACIRRVELAVDGHAHGDDYTLVDSAVGLQT